MNQQTSEWRSKASGKHNQTPQFRTMVISVGLAHAVVFAGLLALQGCGPAEQQRSVSGPEETNRVAEFERLINQWTQVQGVTGQVTTPETGQVVTLPETTSVVQTAQTHVAEPQQPQTNQPPAKPEIQLPSVETPTPATSTTREYVIQPGDYPLKIARKFGITLEQLYEANPGLDPRRLIPGQKLRIPEPVAKTEQVAPAEAYPGVLHKVEPGDTLIRIARRYGVSVEAIREENNLRSDKILVGQVLKIPTHKKQ